MACFQGLVGIGVSCEPNLAGIKRVFFGDFDEFNGNATVSETGHTITALSGATTGATLYEYNFAKQTGSLTSTITIDETNGVRYYTHLLSLQFNKLEAAKHVEIEALGQAQLIGIVEDNNGKFWYIGVDSYLSATEQNAQTGQSFGDLNGYTTSLSAMSAHLPYEIAFDTFKNFIDGQE